MSRRRAPAGPKLDTAADVDAFLATFTADEIAAAMAELAPEHQGALAAGAAKTSFAEFIRQAWHLVPGVQPTLEWNWHIDALAMHAEEVARGGIEKLAINIGPGYAKSTIMAVLFPAWVWTWWPSCQIFAASYSKEFALRDSISCRSVIASPWYREQFSGPAGWRLRRDQNAKSYFQNTAGGSRYSSGIGGTGRRCHIVIVDDPLDQKDVYSEAVVAATNKWLSYTVSQRFIDADKPRLLKIGQRLGENDTFEALGSDWERMVLPDEADPELRSRTYHLVGPAGDPTRARELFWEDPRTKKGDLLFPARFSQATLDKMKQPGPGNLGADGFACQRQQQPRSMKGRMFRRADWKFYKPPPHIAKHYTSPRPLGCNQEPAIPLPTAFDDELLSMDCAFKDNPTGSQVAIHDWARRGADRFLLYRHSDWLDFPATKVAFTDASVKNPRAVRKLVEDKANGTALIAELTHAIPGIVAVEPEGGKMARAVAAHPYQRAGNCYLPEGAPWLEEFVGRCAAFPGGKLNDDVDTFSQAMRGLEEQPENETGHLDWGRR